MGRCWGENQAAFPMVVFPSACNPFSPRVGSYLPHSRIRHYCSKHPDLDFLTDMSYMNCMTALTVLTDPGLAATVSISAECSSYTETLFLFHSTRVKQKQQQILMYWLMCLSCPHTLHTLCVDQAESPLPFPHPCPKAFYLLLLLHRSSLEYGCTLLHFTLEEICACLKEGKLMDPTSSGGGLASKERKGK